MSFDVADGDHVHRSACAEHSCPLLTAPVDPLSRQAVPAMALALRAVAFAAGTASVSLAFDPTEVALVSALDQQHAATGSVLLLAGLTAAAFAFLPTRWFVERG